MSMRTCVAAAALPLALLAAATTAPVARAAGSDEAAQGSYSYTITPLNSPVQSWPTINFSAPYFYFLLTNTSPLADTFKLKVINNTEPGWFPQVCLRQSCFPDSANIPFPAGSSDTVGVNLVPFFDGMAEADFVVTSQGDPGLSSTFHITLFAGTFAVGVDVIPPAPALRLAQNFPNPAVGPTRIPFALPRTERVTLRVFDAAGRVVATLVDRTLSAGPHSVEWAGEISAGRRVPGGVYFYRLEAESGSLSKRMIVLK